ncbi:MAG: histidine ammonia-lyase [Pirellulaceae bacterium]
MTTYKIQPGKLTLSDLRSAVHDHDQWSIGDDSFNAVMASQATVQSIVAQDQTVYGINTGFGLLAHEKISPQDLKQLQVNLVLSHAAGVGANLSPEIVRLTLLLKINSLARGYSGVRRSVIDTLLQMANRGVVPQIPCQGSVGASGDLAPLAHLACALIGLGEVQMQDEKMDAAAALSKIGCAPIELEPKEGLALLNGTQVSTALALDGLFSALDVFAAAVVAGAMSVDAALGSDAPFDARVHEVRLQPGQIDCAAAYRSLLAGSEIRQSHADCDKVQDPYSLRCQPQVMGACLDQMRYAAGVLEREANAVSDNPLVFADSGEVLSGGNFHAEPVALAADALAVAIAEIGALSERRIALLMDTHLSSLPPFLVEHGGVDSGFMIAQVTAAALASENKSLAHPASVDSLPTSANQEDHVSMATFAARRLGQMARNTAAIVAIELLAAAQGIDFRKPLKTSAPLETARQKIRGLVAFYDHDRLFAPDIEKITRLVLDGEFQRDEFCNPNLI